VEATPSHPHFLQVGTKTNFFEAKLLHVRGIFREKFINTNLNQITNSTNVVL